MNSQARLETPLPTGDGPSSPALPSCRETALLRDTLLSLDAARHRFPSVDPVTLGPGDPYLRGFRTGYATGLEVARDLLREVAGSGGRGIPGSRGKAGEIRREERRCGKLRLDSEEAMSRVKELEREIEKLPPEELAELRDWLLERDRQDWDRQIERDAAAGKLEKLFKKSIDAHNAGESKEI